jgi:hypothetical protein
MKFNDYLHSDNYFKNDFITLTRMESLYKSIGDCDCRFDVRSLDLNTNVSMIDNSKKIVLSLNPDLDFPRPFKKLIKHYDNSPYDDLEQTYLDNLSYDSKIETSQLNEIPEYIQHIFCHSVGKAHSKVSMVPIGRDFKNVQIFPTVDLLKKYNKKILCYYNCTLPPKNTYHWYGMIRQHIYDNSVHKSFIYTKKCDIHPRSYSYEDILTYYDDLSKSKFMICPRGCGIDTYRMWDCIHMGCIPIVEKYEGYQQFEDLPIFYVNSWNEIDNFTPELLEKKWNEMLDIEYNYDKLRLSYWEHKILNSLPKL